MSLVTSEPHQVRLSADYQIRIGTFKHLYIQYNPFIYVWNGTESAWAGWEASGEEGSFCVKLGLRTSWVEEASGAGGVCVGKSTCKG